VAVVVAKAAAVTAAVAAATKQPIALLE
jgi:hypothetical protein